MAWTYNTAEDVPSEGPYITTIAVAFTAASLLAGGLRFYVRAILVKNFGPDDWVLLVTWFASLGFAVVSIIQTKWGLGLLDPADIPVENLYNFGLYMGAPFYISSILGFKLSLLLSYLRFFPAGLFKILDTIVAVACTMFHISFLLVQINLCTPVAKQWDPAVTGGHCIPAVPFYTTMASLTIIFDLFIMFLPFPVLYRSKIQRRKKVVLLGLFALGLFITVIQIVRIQTIKQLEKGTVDSAKLIMWSMVENNLGIVVSCIPTFAPLIKYFSEKSRRGTNTSGATRTRKSGYGLQAWRQSRRLSKFNHHAAVQPLSSVVDGREFDVSGTPSRQDPASRQGSSRAGGSGEGRKSSSDDGSTTTTGPGIVCKTEVRIETETVPPLPALSPALSAGGGGGRRSPSMIAFKSAPPQALPLPSPRAASMIALKAPSPEPRSPSSVTFAPEPVSPRAAAAAARDPFAAP